MLALVLPLVLIAAAGALHPGKQTTALPAGPLDPAPPTQPAPTDTSSAPGPTASTTPPTAPTAPAAPQIPEAGPGTWQVAAHEQRSPDRNRRTVRVRVQVEHGVPVDPEQAAALMAEVLHDRRSWVGDGKLHFDFVGRSAEHDLTLHIASPETTDRLCRPADTGGELSCRNGNLVMFNAKRWLLGAPAYGTDLDGYLRYLVNHEVGHFVGHGHTSCPAEGRRASVMMQQTKGLDGCTANPWPNP